ncbi:hypothetical protein ATCC90586_009774 [Pythium insidiosum]|nr:hypothetical protein ATCC90586_009774 [Pythium insidiosum]
MSDYEEEDEKWIQWFCSLSGNEHFCEVPTSYIEDSFNLYGLRALIPNFQDALNIILDMTDIPYDDDVPPYAAELYGMIHARYIITSHGLDAMMKKYRDRDFGVCPRALCDGQPVVPAGMHDEWKQSEMKVFCPRCRDLYTPVTEYQSPPIDGAYFGTTFPHLFFMTYRELEPPPSTVLYVPRIFGYKIHNRGANRRRLLLTSNEQEEDGKQRTRSGGISILMIGAEEEAQWASPGDVADAVDEVASAVGAQLRVDGSPAWEDVTDLFKAAAKELKVGQLVHAEHFSLYDSMSALELLDPKMDAGMQLLQRGTRSLPVSERVRQNAVQLTFPSGRDVLATLNELLRCEAAWLDGQPLAQTLLTSVYLHRDGLRALLNSLLGGDDSADLETQLDAMGGRASDTLLLVVATSFLFSLHTANHVREVVVRADIYEEEDFSPASGFDLSIFDTWTPLRMHQLMDFTLRRLRKLLEQQRASIAAKGASKKAAKKKSSGKKAVADAEPGAGATDALDSLDTNPKVGLALCEAMLRRLELRHALHVVYTSLGLTEAEVDLHLARSRFDELRTMVQRMSMETLELDPECFSGKPIGFDKTLSRLLMSGSPPREVTLPSLDDAFKILDSLLRDLGTACAPNNQSPSAWERMEDVRIFLSDFSRQRPSIVARSYVMLLLYCDKKIYGRFGFMDWLSDEMVMNGVPSVLLSTQEGVRFSSRCIETVYESLKVYLHHRSRQRARIEMLLEDWSALQIEAAAVDDHFTTEMAIPKGAYPRYFTAWTLEQVVTLMIHYVLLGLELELYAPSEYSTVYWYLDYLCGSRLQNLQVTWGFLDKMKEIMKEHGRGRAGQSDSKDSLPQRFEREIQYMEMLRSMMRALFQVFAAMERDGSIPSVAPIFGSPTVRFQHRFAAFQSLHFPAALTFDDFTSNSDFSRFGVDLIYKSAEECFKVARTHGEALMAAAGKTSRESGEQSSLPKPETGRHAEVQIVVRTAVANAVELARLEKLSDGRGKSSKQTASVHKSATTDFAMHPHFPVVRFTSDRR